ncbi:MAG: NHL repeat-containing protein, partial [Phycisphaerae bacterium]
ADMVIGQPDFTSAVPNNGGVGPSSFFLPQGLAVDDAGNLWVCDAFNNRVLRFDNPESDADPGIAELVIGQFDLNSNLQNLTGDKNSPTAQSLLFPGRVLVDDSGVYIADSGNSRVLHYAAPTENTPAADRVFGQFGSFLTRAENNDGTGAFGCCASAENMLNPIGIVVSPTGSLFVADWMNHRILRFDEPLTTDAVADAVYGQPTFTANDPNNGGADDGLTLPIDLCMDELGNLYAADSGNHRVLRFENPMNDTLADAVYGQLGSLAGSSINHGLGPAATDADGLFGATGVSIAPSGEILILDTENMRTLRYAAPALLLPGDMNCDGAVTVSDIGGFVLALTDAAAYGVQFPDCEITLADVNDDDAITVSDIGPFVQLLIR